MTASAVSQQIRALEAHLGAPLFMRKAQRVELNQLGRAYLSPLQHALFSIKGATEGLFGSTNPQVVFVHAVLLFGHGILAGCYPKFQIAYPSIAMNLSTSVAKGDAFGEYADLRIVFGSDMIAGDESDLLMSEVLYPVARADIAAQINCPEDLARFTMIDVSSHRASWPHFFQMTGVVAESAAPIVVDNSIVAYGMAAAGCGVALAHAPASDAMIAASSLVPCLGDFRLKGLENYYLTYPNISSLRHPAAAFRDWLLSELRAD